MKANELRIGNLVNDYQFKNTIKVSIGVLEEMENGMDFYEPITLTEEWLVKFGFKDGYLFDSDDNSIEVDLKRQTVYLSGNEAMYNRSLLPCKNPIRPPSPKPLLCHDRRRTDNRWLTV